MIRQLRRVGKKGAAAALLILGLCLTGALPARAQRAAASALKAKTPSDAELRGLVRSGRLLRQSHINDYALTMYQRALALSQNIENQELRLLLTAEAVVSFYKTGNGAAAGPTIEPINSGLKWAQTPETIAVARLALAYSAASQGNALEFDNQIGQALSEAYRSNSLLCQGDCLLGKAEVRLNQNKAADALEPIKQALQMYAQAGDSLSLSEAYQALSRYYNAVGNAVAEEQASRKVLDTMNDLSKGPILDTDKLVGMVPQLQAAHLESARQGDYQKASNEILSLLVLKKYQFQLKSREEAVKGLGIREGELLAYLAIYTIKLGNPLPGMVFLGYSDSMSQGELNPVLRSRQRWLAGRFWRLAGYPQSAMELFDKCDEVLARLGNPDAALAVGLKEERGLALLQLGRKDEAAGLLQQALETAQGAKLANDTGRLQSHLQALKAGKLDLDAAATPAPTPEEPATPRKAKFAGTGPEPFRSPFAADYPWGASRTAAAGVLKVQLERLDPTPTPLNLSPELLMNSQLYDEAAAKLLKILREQGDSPERLMQLGTCYYNLHEWEKARDAFQRLLKLDPKNGAAQQYLGFITKRLQTPVAMPAALN